MTVNPCKCGSKEARLQDYGDMAWVKCPECGQKGKMLQRLGEGDPKLNAVADWNLANPVEDRPLHVTTKNAEQYLAWCDRAVREEVVIWRVEVKDNGVYRLSLRWPTERQEETK